MRQTVWSILLTGALVCAPVLAFAPRALAQQVPVQATGQAPAQGLYRILDADRLLQDSLMGQQILARNRDAEAALSAENTAIADQLVVEERELTDLRPTLTPEEFRTRADAFDAHVEEIRTERSERAAALARQSETDVQRFFDTALPVLDQLMAAEGIAGLVRPEMMVLWAEWLDVTDQAIQRMDAVFLAAQQNPEQQDSGQQDPGSDAQPGVQQQP